MTKSDMSKRNAAVSDVLRSGHGKLLDESMEVDARSAGKIMPGWSKVASQTELQNLWNVVALTPGRSQFTFDSREGLLCSVCLTYL